MTSTEVAWLAGLLEGEGYFAVQGSSIGSPIIQLLMTDRDVVDRVAAVFQTNVNTVKRYEGRKQAYRVNAYGSRAAGLIMTIYPFLGARRRAKVKEVLAGWKASTGRGRPGQKRKHLGNRRWCFA